MLDIGWQELFFIGILALIVVGPKDLPGAMRAVARAVNKLRGLSREFQNGLNDIMREAELDELKQKVQQVQKFDMGAEIKNSIDPTGTLDKEFDPSALSEDGDKRAHKTTESTSEKLSDIKVAEPADSGSASKSGSGSPPQTP
jgi:sec-independent protein translocase protein TatB